MISKGMFYEAPKVIIITISPQNYLLITSNEGLGYEDLFSQAPNAFPINEEPFEIIP